MGTGRGEEQHHKWNSFRHLCSVSTMLRLSIILPRSSSLMKHVFLLYCHHFLNESNQREHYCIPGGNASLAKLKSLSVPLCQSMCDWCQDPLTTSLLVQTGAVSSVTSVVPICRPSLHGKFKLLHHCFQSCMPLTLDIVLCIIPMSLIK